MKETKSTGRFDTRFLLRTFRYRNYRLFFTGQGFSLIGTWMQQTAMSWLVYRITNSTFYLGLIGFTGQVPIFLFASLAGVYADRHNRRHILILTQILAMIQSLMLAVLTLTGRVEVWHLIILSAFLGMINSFDMPARQSFIIDMVDNVDDLGNTIAFNSFMFNAARLIGPSIAGLVIAITSEGVCFMINTLSFLTIILALLAMVMPLKEKIVENAGIIKGLVEGYMYAYREVPIRYILMHLCVMSLIGMPCAVLMPYFARDQLHGGPATLGFILGSSGLGALFGVLYLASRKSVKGLEIVIPASSIIFSAGLMTFSFSTSFTASLIFVIFMGFGMIVMLASCNTILQTIVHEDKRGRIMSLYAMAFAGMTPFGSLLIGALSSRIGPPHTLMISGACCIAGSLFFFVKFPRKAFHSLLY
jgi:MFS family permease